MTKRKLSMPFWCVANSVGDPFGPAVMDNLSSLEICDILCDAKAEGLIHFTSTHDDNLVDWDPTHPEDDLDKNSDTYKTLRSLKKKMDAVGLTMKMVTCSLHGNSVFRNGGLTNPDPDIRALAAQKVMRTIRIGNFFGAEYLTYWVARDGFECQFSIPWDRCYTYIEQGLNLATRYIKENHFSIKAGTIESKPNEPRGEMFLATCGHALALISRLEDPDFWGVNPEILQHEEMTNLSAVNAIATAVHADKLFFIHLGNQKPGQFDNDNPTMTGMDGIKEIISVFWMLNKLKWNGHVEYDNHVLRTDTAPGKKNAVAIRRQFIKNNVESYRLAERKADELSSNATLNKLYSKICNKKSALATALDTYDINTIRKAKIPYDKLNTTPVEIAELDYAVNKILLGE